MSGGPRVKTISLDDETWPIAQSMPNFSRFVRECLTRYYAASHGQLNCRRSLREDDRLCVPMRTKAEGGRCVACWPAGKPDHEDWSEYVRGPRDEQRVRQLTIPERGWVAGDRWTNEIPASEHYLDHDWIQARAVEVNPVMFSMEDIPIKGNAPKSAKTKKPKRGPFQLITGILSRKK